MSKQKMAINLRLALMGLAIAAATLLALPMAANQAYAAAPPDKRDFFGTVFAVEANVIQVTVADGTIVDVTITEDTVIRLPLKEDAQLTDLFDGDTVAVSLNDDLSSASKIFVIPGKTQYRHVPGEITSSSDDSITLQPLATGSEPIVFIIGPDTEVVFRAGATEFVEGVFAVVLTRRNLLTGELSPNALEIHVAAGKPRVRHTVTRPEVAGTDLEAENEAKFIGVFTGLDDDGNWIIGGRTVAIDADTEIRAGMVVGQIVRAKGELLEDGTLLAKEIKARGKYRQGRNRARIEGIFEGVNDEGNWLVGGTVVVINDETDTDGVPFIGQRVVVTGLVQDQQTLIAREVENIIAHEAGGASEEHRRDVKLEGIYQGVNDDGDWIINGVEVSLDHLTRLEGTPEVGRAVEVKGVLQNGKIVALRIEFEDHDNDFRVRPENRVTLRGLVDAITDDGSVITIDSHEVHIRDLTEIDGEIVVGVGVKVLAIIMDDGTLVAKEIDVREHDTDVDEDGEREAVRIDGIIDLVNDDGTIVVNGITIVLRPRITAGRMLTEGLEIRAFGVFQDDGSLLAGRIRGGHVDDDDRDETERIRGTIEEVIIDGDLVVAIVVDGRTIHIQALTEIDSPLRPGVNVVVEVIATDRGLVAKEIDQDRRGRRDGTVSGEAKDRRGSERADGANASDDSDSLRELNGIVIAYTDGLVVLRGGRTVAINAGTRIDGELYIGAEVEIKLVIHESGLLVAKRIEVTESDDESEVEESELGNEAEVDDDESDDESDGPEIETQREVDVKLEGIVREFSSTRLVIRNVATVLINRDTEIDGDLYEGAVVEVRAVRRSDGTYVAVKIKVERPRDARSGGDDGY